MASSPVRNEAHWSMSTSRRVYKSDRKQAPSTPPTAWASAVSAIWRGFPISAHQSRKALRKPWTVARSASPWSRRTFVRAMLLRGWPVRVGEGKTRPLPSPCPLARARTSRAASGERHAMLSAPLHALPGNPPFLCVKVDSGPRSAARLPRPSSGQDQEREAKLHRLARSRLLHGRERRSHLPLRQRPKTVEINGSGGCFYELKTGNRIRERVRLSESRTAIRRDSSIRQMKQSVPRP